MLRESSASFAERKATMFDVQPYPALIKTIFTLPQMIMIKPITVFALLALLPSLALRNVRIPDE